MLSIDLGSSATKVVIAVEKRELLSHSIPSVFHVPANGRVLVGEDAIAQQASMPEGGIQQLTFDRSGFGWLYRQGRRISVDELLQLLLAEARAQSIRLHADLERLTSCVVVVPASLGLQHAEWLKSVALRVGFRSVETIDASVSGMTQWRTETGQDCPHALVVDIGANRTEISLVEKVRGAYRVSPEVEVAVGPGVNQLDSALWDRVRVANSLDPDQQEAIGLMTRVRSLREKFCSEQHSSQTLSVNGRTLDIAYSDFETCLSDFYRQSLKALPACHRQTKEAGIENCRLIAMGGGCLLPGLKRSFEGVGWTDQVEQISQPVLAAAMGASHHQEPSRFACKNCGADYTLQQDCCTNCGCSLKPLQASVQRQTSSQVRSSTSTPASTKPRIEGESASAEGEDWLSPFGVLLLTDYHITDLHQVLSDCAKYSREAVRKLHLLGEDWTDADIAQVLLHGDVFPNLTALEITSAPRLTAKAISMFVGLCSLQNADLAQWRADDEALRGVMTWSKLSNLQSLVLPRFLARSSSDNTSTLKQEIKQVLERSNSGVEVQ